MPGYEAGVQKKYGITVNYVRMSAGEALARVQAEKANPQFDIWWGGPIDSFVAAKEYGVLEPTTPRTSRTCSIRINQGQGQHLGRHLCRQPGLRHQQGLVEEESQRQGPHFLG